MAAAAVLEVDTVVCVLACFSREAELKCEPSPHWAAFWQLMQNLADWLLLYSEDFFPGLYDAMQRNEDHQHVRVTQWLYIVR